MVKYIGINRIESRMRFSDLMPSSLTKEGDAHEHNGSLDFIASNICGSVLHRQS